MSRSGASMEALIGLAKQKLKEKNKEKKEAEAAAKLKSTAAKKRPYEEVKDIFMDTTIESKEDSPKDITENVKESKSKKKKVSSDLPKEDDKGDKEPEAKVEEVPANPIDAIMKEIASLQADVETFEKIKKVKKAKKRKRKHSSSSSSSSDESDDEPSVELEEKVEEEIAVEVKGLGSLVTGYDSDEFEDDENFELSKPKVAEKVMPKASPNLDDDFIFLKPTIPANMIPPQVAGGPKREKVKKIGLCDRLMQQGGQTENKTENASTPLKPISAKDPINAVYVYNPLTGKREKAESKPSEANAGTDSKDAQILSVSRSPLMSESLKDSILDNSSKGETKSITAEPTPLKTSNSANEPQYKYNPLTGYRDLLVETKPFLGPFTVGASSVKAEKVEKTENAEAVAQPFARKGICKFFNMKFGCRHGENCRFKHEKYKQAAFNYENAYQNVQGQETKASVMTGSLENKETDISPSEFYRTFIAKSLKQKKGAGIFFEKAKENLIPEETNVMAEKTNERIDVIKQNGLKGETRELVDNYNDDAANKQEKTPRRTEKNKDFVKCNREIKEIAGGIINEIIDTIFATRSFGNSKSKSRSRSSSISLSNSSDLEEESNQEARTLKRREKRKRQEPKRKPRSKPCSRSRSRSQSKDRKKSRNSPSTDKERKKSSRRQRKQKSRSRDRDRIRYSRSRSPSRPRVRVLPSSYLEQVRNGIPPEWNEEKYKQPRHIELLEEENEPNSRNKRRKNDSEEKIILPGLEELLSIEKNKECPRVLKNSIGIVTSIINESYAIAAVTLPYSKVSDNERKGPFRVLFDTCEFWIENRTASDLGISLEQVITVGDYVKINAILIEKPNIRNINYMATATKTSDNISNLLKEKFTEEIATNDIKEVSKSKLDNFDVVVKFLSSSPITEEEMKIEMKSEKDADSNLLSRAREWKNWLYYNTQSSAKSSGLERNLKKLSDNLSEDEGNRRKLTRTKVSKEFREKERRRRSSRDSDEIQCIGGKSRDSIKGKNGICDKRFNKSSKRSSSSDDEDERDRPSRSRDKSRRNGSRSSETRKRKKSSSRSRSQERKNKRSQEKERRSNRSRSRGKEYRKRRPSKSPPKKYRSRSREKETERKPSRRLREEEYERKTSSRSQEKDRCRKRSDRSSEKDFKRRRSTSRERKPKERDSKRKSSTESLVSLSGREPCTRLPANFSYWNENLIKCLDDGEYIDCIHCQETLATKPEHNFLPYYLDHYSSVEHALKMVESSVIDQDCVNDYIAHSSELDYFIQLELDRGAAQVIYDEGDLRLFLCKYCQKVGTTAWHFYKLKNSKLHSPEELRL